MQEGSERDRRVFENEEVFWAERHGFGRGEDKGDDTGCKEGGRKLGKGEGGGKRVKVCGCLALLLHECCTLASRLIPHDHSPTLALAVLQIVQKKVPLTGKKSGEPSFGSSRLGGRVVHDY